MNKYETPTSTIVRIMLERTLLQDSYNDDNNENPRRDYDDYF